MSELYKVTYNEAENICLKIYMSIHVSEYNEMEEGNHKKALRAAWDEGQKLFEELGK